MYSQREAGYEEEETGTKGQTRDKGKDRKGQMKGESQGKRDLLPVYREQRTQETAQQAVRPPLAGMSLMTIHTHILTSYLPVSWVITWNRFSPKLSHQSLCVMVTSGGL